MLESFSGQFIFGITLVVCLLAFVAGTHREKVAAMLCLTGLALEAWLRTLWPDAEVLRHLVLDGGILIGFVTLCWKAPHPWPLWASGLQLFNVMAAVTTLLNPQLSLSSYLILHTILYMSVVLVIGVGTLQTTKLRRKQSVG